MKAGIPKQYLSLAGKTLAEHTLGVCCRLRPSTASSWWRCPLTTPGGRPCRSPLTVGFQTVAGGETRAESVRNGLAQVLMDGGEDAWVLVHDMARPLVRLSDIQVCWTRPDEQGAILALPVVDTIKQAADDLAHWPRWIASGSGGR